MEVELHSLLPRNKSDEERVGALVALGYPAVAPVLADLVEWLQDGNWPISRPISRFLVSIGEPVVPLIRNVLAGNDDAWKDWCIDLVIVALAPEIGEMLRPELERTAYQPTSGEREEEVNGRAQAALERLNRARDGESGLAMCQCQTLVDLDEERAKPYVAEHLQPLNVNESDWTITYLCPETGIQWIRYYPHPDWPGGGPWRLRRVGL